MSLHFYLCAFWFMTRRLISTGKSFFDEKKTPISNLVQRLICRMIKNLISLVFFLKILENF